MGIRARSAGWAAGVLVVLAVSGCTSGGDAPTPPPSAAPAPPTATAAPAAAPPATPETARPAAPPVVVVGSGSGGAGTGGGGGQDTNATLGPTGWQGLDLGTPADEAAASGIFVDAGPVSGCTTWGAVGAAAIDSAVVSPEHGVEAISALPGKVLATPEGLRVGWTAAQVARTYPSFTVDQADPATPAVVPVPQNPAAGYRVQFDDRDTVIAFSLVLLAGSCPA